MSDKKIKNGANAAGGGSGDNDFNYIDNSSSDFKRLHQIVASSGCGSPLESDNGNDNPDDDDAETDGQPVSEKINEYLRDLLGEKVAIDHKYPNADRLLDQGKGIFVGGGWGINRGRIAYIVFTIV